MNRSCLRLPVLLLAAALGPACSGGPTAVSVSFQAVVGSQPFVCGQSYSGLGTTGTVMTPTDFRFYVSNVRLVDAGGTEAPLTLTQDGMWQQGGVAFLSFRDKTAGCSDATAPSNSTVRGQVAAGTYTRLRFDLGLPAGINHLDVSTAAAPLNFSDMYWSWQTGYRFLRIEGPTMGVTPDYNIHLGSNGCSGDPGKSTCLYPNLSSVDLSPFDAAANTVVADLARLVTGVNLDQGGTESGCLSDPADPTCAPIFHNLGLALGPEKLQVPQQRFFGVK